MILPNKVSSVSRAEFGSFEGGLDGEHNGRSFVKIYFQYETQGRLFSLEIYHWCKI